jgi:hypothetical protein
MSVGSSTLVDAAIFHSNRYHADAACSHCGGLIRHENWCITHNQQVFYAYEIVVEPQKLQLGDQLILHALGVNWIPEECQAV